MKRVLISVIERYQDISPILWQSVGAVLFTSQCRFHPTCSEYCKQSIEKYSLSRALLKSVWRFVRCQPLARGGYDPA